MLGFAHVSSFAVPTVEGSLKEFLRAPAATYDDGPVSVLEVIKFFAQVQGGVHLGVPKLPFEVLAHSVIGHMGNDVGRMWMRALIAIATVTVDAARPLVDAMVADRPELADGAWSESRRVRESIAPATRKTPTRPEG
ncbi:MULTISPECIES: hypothetical protein [unclassified Microbacterium]|uniref:hypothetical protein n=1 Tax=unclassified Microbacterium TaxID=2609290 RepID=UPI001604A445|nr:MULTISPECIES: hypothetical protein [unclassified Microbacterium]QNA93277.1 hypothetical protein G4G29_14835 [Microbacterium sp. Se63.02b]QYM63487.1 hypothetical protein K1X59_14885 [Microbacterium sp. Se5.02b]